MKLHYLHTGESTRVLVLGRDTRRIELHVRPVGEKTWALVALVGNPQSQPGRKKYQGPYASAQAAEGALRAIAQALLEQGFSVERQVHPVWAVQAQRLARAIRRERESYAGNSWFDPDQHEPFW